ncbi:unnamed protein product, partial [Ceratitis capitata]
ATLPRSSPAKILVGNYQNLQKLLKLLHELQTTRRRRFIFPNRSNSTKFSNKC